MVMMCREDSSYIHHLDASIQPFYKTIKLLAGNPTQFGYEFSRNCLKVAIHKISSIILVLNSSGYPVH